MSYATRSRILGPLTATLALIACSGAPIRGVYNLPVKRSGSSFCAYDLPELHGQGVWRCDVMAGTCTCYPVRF